ncbi:MAG: hypothetical protein IH851_10160 [Armatimonadetes bacterium]|nr:hypothetical protein [Armatimonadota bacterium]
MLVEPTGDQQTAVGYAYELTGFWAVRCIVTLSRPGEQDVNYTLDQVCVAIGGPLSLDVYGAEPGATPPEHDDYDEDNPW